MKKVLYITNIQVPYRVLFFNELAKGCELTVLYERSSSDNRDAKWSKSNSDNYKKFFLDGLKTGRETSFSFKILKYILGQYDSIVIGCYNSPVQMFAMLIMRLFRIEFIISTDGELFIGDKGIKNKFKKFFLKGASIYLTAGEKSAFTLRNVIGNKKIVPYYFSSLTQDEIEENSKNECERKDYILVVGQYYPYKGMDIAAEIAKKMPEQKFKFVGTGKRTDIFVQECRLDELNNVEVIPFLQKEDLYEEYRKCKCLLLPTRQECWGLVVNEAASFGTPIVSTCGSGAAIEFLSDEYKGLLSQPDNADNLISAIKYEESLDIAEYSNLLISKSKNYSVEKSALQLKKVI